MKRILAAPATAALALLCGLIFLFKPAQMFEANAPFFYYGFVQIALLLVPAFLACFALLAGLASLGAPRWRHALAAALGGLALAAWANATFVASPGGALDGRTILVPLDPQRDLINALLWIAVALAGAALAGWRPQLARRFCGALFVVLAAQSVWIAASERHPWRPEGDTGRLTTLSAEKNVLVILLDTFQADFFEDIVSREPALARAFDGFTYFPNAVSPAPTTYLALPVIHSGLSYEPGQSLRDTYRGSVGQRSFMAQLARNGYDTMVVNAVLNYCPDGTLCDHEGPLVRGRAKTLAEAAAFLVDLGLFRLLPDALKPVVYAEGAWMTTQWFAEDRAMTSNGVLDLMAGGAHVGAAAPAARFLHLFGSHPPATLDAACQPVRSRIWTRPNAIAQDHCALTKVDALLRKLRSAGIYDRTVIVLLGDHGAGLPRDGKTDWPWGSAAAALLAVKPFGARGPLTHSARVVGLRDVPATICAWTGDCRMATGADVLQPAQSAPSYPFYAYFWRHEYWLAEAVPILERYEVRGPPQERASWHKAEH